MRKSVFFAVFLAMFVLFLLNHVSAENIDSCQTLDFGDTYPLTQNVSSSGTCFDVISEDVILDCNGFTINYSSSSDGYGVYSDSDYTTVKNCNIKQANSNTNYSFGIYLDSSNNLLFLNNITTSGSESFGIFVSTMPAYSYPCTFYDSFNNISYNRITTFGNMGIMLQCGSENDIANNILNSTSGGYGIVMFSSFINNLTSNTISSDGYGIYVSSDSNSNKLTSNLITSNFYGISVFNSSNNNLTSNRITTASRVRHGINIQNSSYNLLTANIINTSGELSAGINLVSDSHDNVLASNIIKTSGSEGYGIYVESSPYNNLTENNITTLAEGGSHGIYLVSSTNDRVISNTMSIKKAIAINIVGGIYGEESIIDYFIHDIENNTDAGKPIYYIKNNNSGIMRDLDANQILVVNSTNFTIQNVTMGGDSDGISFFYVNNSRINSTSIRTWAYEGYGIQLFLSSNNNVTNTTILTWSEGNYGMHLIGATGNNIANNDISTAMGYSRNYGIRLYDSDKNNIRDTIINARSASDISLKGSGINNFTNATFYKQEVNFESGNISINVFWLADVYVNDSSGNPLEGANVTSTTTSGTLANWSLTNSSGYTTRLTLREYRQNATSRYSDTNYTFNASKSGYQSNGSRINLTTNYILPSNRIWISLNSSGPANYLVASFGNNPVDNYNSKSNSVTFDMKCSSNISIDRIQLWTNTTGTWHANYTNSSYTNNTWLNITVDGIADGKYRWAVYCNDTSGNSDWTDTNRIFTIDSTSPTIALPLYVNATRYKNTQNMIFNISVSDSGVGASYCTINVAGNSNQTIPVNLGWCNGTYSLAGITDGNKTINAYANDSLGNSAFNNSYVVWIDSTAPIAYQGTNPVDDYDSGSQNIIFDMRCRDNFGISTIQLWGNWSGTWQAEYINSSYTNDSWLNITLIGIPDGNNSKWAVYCNDTSGLTNWTTNRTLNVDVGAPTSSFGTNPADSYWDIDGNIVFDMKCSDSIGVSTIQLWTNTTGTWQANYSNSSYQSDTWLNITVNGIQSGDFRWAVWCNDTNSNIDWTNSNRTFGVDSVAPIARFGVLPIDGYEDSGGSITFYLRCSDNIRVSTIQLLTNISGAWQSSYSNSSYQNNTLINQSLSVTSGYYVWAVYCNDTLGNSNQTQNRTFSSAYTAEEEEEQKKGGGGGGGGGGDDEETNVSDGINQTYQEDNSLINTEITNQTKANETDEDEKTQEKFNWKNFLIYLIIILILIILIIILVIFRKKKASNS